MSNQLLKVGIGQAVKQGVRHAALVLAAIPLLLQPVGQAGAAESGPLNGSVSGAAGGRIVLSTKARMNYDLEQLFPNLTNFRVVTDHPNIAVGDVQSGSSVMVITPKAPGAANLTIMSASAGMNVPVTLKVMVVDPGSDGLIDIADIGKWMKMYPEAIESEADTVSLLASIRSRSVNGIPVAKVASLPQSTVTAGQSNFIPFAAADAFSDPEGDELTITARSDNEAVVTASYTDEGISLAGHGKGMALVKIQAKDAADGTAEISLPVTVEQANSGPVQAQAVTTYWLGGQEKVSIAMDSLFRDPDGDPLTFTYTRTVKREAGEAGKLTETKPETAHSVTGTDPVSHVNGTKDRGASVRREGNTLIVTGRGEGQDFEPTMLEVTAVDAHFPNSPVTQRIQVLPASSRGDLLANRKIFNHARMEIDLHQKFNYASVAGATYRYYLGDEGRTVTAGTYSNAYIEGNKLIIEGKASGKYGAGGQFHFDHYKVLGLFEDQGQASEMIDSFDLRVDELPWQGTGLNLREHLPWPEVIRSYSISGQFTESPEDKASGQHVNISWTYRTDGTVTVYAVPRYWEEADEKFSPAVTYTIRFVPHPPSS